MTYWSWDVVSEALKQSSRSLSHTASWLKVMAKKCHLIKMEVKYMGYVESIAGVNVDPKKVEAVQSFDRPLNLKQLRPLLGLASYYRRFIPQVPAPLYTMMNKDVPYNWTEQCERTF